MAKTKVRLTHVSHKKGAEGVTGDEISIDSELAERWRNQGGCRILEEEEAPKQPAKPSAKE